MRREPAGGGDVGWLLDRPEERVGDHWSPDTFATGAREGGGSRPSREGGLPPGGGETASAA